MSVRVFAFGTHCVSSKRRVTANGIQTFFV
jgi:hypothetical protein